MSDLINSRMSKYWDNRNIVLAFVFLDTVGFLHVRLSVSGHVHANVFCSTTSLQHEVI